MSFAGYKDSLSCRLLVTRTVLLVVRWLRGQSFLSFADHKDSPFCRSLITRRSSLLFLVVRWSQGRSSLRGESSCPVRFLPRAMEFGGERGQDKRFSLTPHGRACTPTSAFVAASSSQQLAEGAGQTRRDLVGGVDWAP